MATVSGVSIIGGITFNFTESGYNAPTWSGSTYTFGESFGTLNQIYSDADYVYAATNRGLSVVSMLAEEEVGYINYNLGFTTVFGNNTKVYLGTVNSGIKYINKTCISGTVNNPEDLVSCLADYVSPFGITSQNIRYIHGNGDNYLMCCTSGGVDVYHMNQTLYRSSTTVSGARKCFMTTTGKFYYTISGTNEWSLNRVNSPLWDWEDPDYIYSTGGSILSSGILINDMFVTENTSGSEYNTLFLATSSGVYVIPEKDNQSYGIYYVGE